MKRTVLSILAVILCLSLCACGNGESAAPTMPEEPKEWLISTEYITQSVIEFDASEEWNFLQDTWASGRILYGADKAYGPYLTGAAEVYVLGSEDKDQHFILMGIEGDMQLEDIVFDRDIVAYDIDSGSYYDSISWNRAELQARYEQIKDTPIGITFGCSSNYSEAVNSFPDNFTGGKRGYAFVRELSADEIAYINTALNLEPLPDRGAEAAPELNTTPEERQQVVVDALKQFAGSELYHALYPSSAAPLVQAAAEIVEEISLRTHSLVIKLADANTDDGSLGKLVVDMETGALYTDREFDPEWDGLDTPEKVAHLLAGSYDRILGGEEEIFFSQNETNYKLSDGEITAINQELVNYFAQNPIAPPPTEPVVDDIEFAEEVEQTSQNTSPAVESKPLSVSNQFVIDVICSIRNTDQYQSYAENPATIGLEMAYEYYLEDFEGFEVHLIMLRVTGIDTDIHGITGNVFLIDASTGTVYSEFDLGLDWSGNIGKVEDVYVAILCDLFWHGEQNMIWSEAAQLTSIPQTDLDAINNALN
ncbi:MAG: hypothetical protein IKT52_09890 [Oscillospiraceae bacterium]|nr:hypothetical protein [Oscillospiraceae bacterium]